MYVRAYSSNVNRSFICNSLKLKVTQYSSKVGRSINWVWSCHGILHNNEKELLSHEMAWMNFIGQMFSESSQTHREHITQFQLHEGQK